MASLLWGGISLYSSPPTWDYTLTPSASLTVTASPAAAGLNTQTVTAALTVTASTAAAATVTQTISATLLVTPVVTAAAFQGQVVTASLTVTPVVAAQGTTPGTITPITITGATILPSTPITTAYWSSFALWSSPYTYADQLGSATITPVGV